MDNTWKFGKTVVSIDEMDKKTVLKCALHCFKKMFNLNKEDAWCDFKLRVEAKKSRLKFWQHRKKIASSNLLLFATKLEQLDDRARVLGFDIPESFTDVKEMLNQHENEQNSAESKEEKQSVTVTA